jgi:hypothetical protein
MSGMSFSLRRDILNKDKDTPRQEPRRSFGRAIYNKVISLLYDTIPSLSFNRLPHDELDGDTRIWHAGPTQKQAFGSCVNVSTAMVSTDRPGPVLTFHSFSHPLASSTSHVDDAQELSLRALQESADVFPNPYLKSAVSGVSALCQTAKVVQSVGFLQRCIFNQIL